MAVWLFLCAHVTRPNSAIGSGRVALLEAIHRFGSIAAAATSIGRTERFLGTWIKQTNAALGPVIAIRRGRNGGASLTPLGLEILTQFRGMERKMNEVLAEDAKRLGLLVGEDPKTAPAALRVCQVRQPVPSERPLKKKASAQKKRVPPARRSRAKTSHPGPR